MMVLLVHSLTLSVSGWCAEDILSFMPVSSCKCFQKCERKSSSLSEIMSRGNPFLQYQCVKNNSAKASAVNVVVVGIIHMSDPNQSLMVRIVLNLPSFSKGPMKSIVTELQHPLGTGRGCNGPRGFVVQDLFL